MVTDAAKRAFDIVNGYVHFVPYDERINCWVAIRLEDGGTDGTLYHSKRDAVRHQSDEFLCCYFTYRNAPNGFASVKDAQLYMDWNRGLYDAGLRTPDPDSPSGGADIIMPTPEEHIMLQRAAMIRNLN